MDIIGYNLIVNMKELYSTLFQKNFNWYKNSMLQQAKYLWGGNMEFSNKQKKFYNLVSNPFRDPARKLPTCTIGHSLAYYNLPALKGRI